MVREEVTPVARVPYARTDTRARSYKINVALTVPCAKSSLGSVQILESHVVVEASGSPHIYLPGSRG